MTLPRAGAWVLGSMAIFAVILAPIFPFILRWRRKRDRRRLHEQIARAKAEILADGKVEGPKWPYVPHKPWCVGTDARTPTFFRSSTKRVAISTMPGVSGPVVSVTFIPSAAASLRSSRARSGSWARCGRLSA